MLLTEATLALLWAISLMMYGIVLDMAGLAMRVLHESPHSFD